jgi:cation transport ATPase
VSKSATRAAAPAALARTACDRDRARAPGDQDGAEERLWPGRVPGWRLAVCLPLAVAVVALSVVRAAQFTGWQWLALALAGAVGVWGAWPIHRAAGLGLGHGPATVDTLVSLAVGAALAWSLAVILFGRAGALGMTMPFTLTFSAAGGNTIYLDVAAGVAGVALAGRYLESRGTSRSGASEAGRQALDDRAAAVLVPCVIAVAVATLGFWLGAGLPAPAAGSAALAILVVACPCALGLATPTALRAATDRGAELGILVRDSRALETASRAGAVILGTAGGPGSAAAVARIRRLGLSPVLLTGERQGAALAVAAELGIPAERVFGGVGPAGKVQLIAELQAGGIAVAVAGDGVTDAAALARADLGLALGASTGDAAQADSGPAPGGGTGGAAGGAGLVLACGDPAGIADALQLGRAAMTVARGNRRWAVGCSLIAVPVAALGFLSPVLAVLAMAASSALVVISSLRLRRFRPGDR